MDVIMPLPHNVFHLILHVQYALQVTPGPLDGCLPGLIRQRGKPFPQDIKRSAQDREWGPQFMGKVVNDLVLGPV